MHQQASQSPINLFMLSSCCCSDLQVDHIYASAGGTKDTGCPHNIFLMPSLWLLSDLQVDRTYASAGGTIQALRLLFEEGRLMAGNIAGGTHHAFRDRSVWV